MSGDCTAFLPDQSFAPVIFGARHGIDQDSSSQIDLALFCKEVTASGFAWLPICARAHLGARPCGALRRPQRPV